MTKQKKGKTPISPANIQRRLHYKKSYTPPKFCHASPGV